VKGREGLEGGLKLKGEERDYEGATKKDGTNVFCSCREASDANYFRVGGKASHSQPEYIHLTIDSEESKYKNQDFLVMWYGRFKAVSSKGQGAR
jgi:hypothetical protein